MTYQQGCTRIVLFIWDDYNQTFVPLRYMTLCYHISILTLFDINTTFFYSFFMKLLINPEQTYDDQNKMFLHKHF
jgi:hypothetical protein